MKIGDENIERIVFERTKELLNRYGIKGWNMDDLANDCGMSKRTLYKIIGNKEDLLYKCSTNIIEANSRQLKLFINQDEDYYTILDNFTNQIIGEIEEFIITTSKIIRTEYPRISEAIDHRIKEHQKIQLAFFEKGKTEGLLKENVTPKIIVNIINALMKYNLNNSNDTTDFKAKIKEELDFLFMAIRK